MTLVCWVRYIKKQGYSVQKGGIMNQHVLWYSVVLLIVTVLAGGAYLFYSAYCTRIVLFIDDGHLSKKSAEHMQQQLNELLQQTNSLQDIYQRLKQKFPTLLTISFNTFSPTIIKCKVTLDQPYVIMQRSHMTPLVLSRHGFVTTPHDYRSPMLEYLPSVFIDASAFTQCDQQALHQRLQSLPDNFLITHSLQWVKPSEIILTQKDKPLYIYKVTASSNYTPLIEQQLALVHEKIEQKQNVVISTKKQTPKKWIIDVRFKDQIVVSPSSSSATVDKKGRIPV